ncbi:MAG: DinB family protein [Chloroflexota bacterium]
MGISEGEFDILHQTQAIRGELMNILSDADLAYKLPGSNPSLGAICREMGQVEQSYIDAFRTMKQSWNYASVDPALDGSVEKLKTWYASLDADLEAALIALKDKDTQTTMIDRGWPVALGAQFHIYREALLIFYAKATCYLRALGKPLPKQMSGWIG